MLYKYQPKFVKAHKKQTNILDIRQVFVLLFDCVPNMRDVWRTDRLLKNANV